MNKNKRKKRIWMKSFGFDLRFLCVIQAVMSSMREIGRYSKMERTKRMTIPGKKLFIDMLIIWWWLMSKMTKRLNILVNKIFHTRKAKNIFCKLSHFSLAWDSTRGWKNSSFCPVTIIDSKAVGPFKSFRSILMNSSSLFSVTISMLLWRMLRASLGSLSVTSLNIAPGLRNSVFIRKSSNSSLWLVTPWLTRCSRIFFLSQVMARSRKFATSDLLEAPTSPEITRED